MSHIVIPSDYVKATSPGNNILENFRSQLELVRKEKHDFYLKHKHSECKSKEENDMVTGGETAGNFKHVWLAGNCLIIGDPILTGVDEKRLSKNKHVVKIQDFRGATIDDLKSHLVPLLKNKPEHIILYIKTSEVISKTSRHILKKLF